jgi:ABC-type transport system substrate-binding protein
LTFRLTRPVPDFVESAGLSVCVLPAGHPLQPSGVTPPVPSAAPYYVSEYVPGETIVLKRNAFYRGARPHHVDGFVFDLTVDDTQAIDDVISGSADYGWIPNLVFAGRAAELAQRFGVNKKQFFVKPSPFLRMFVLNTSRPLLRDNAPLRRAINFAIDRPALVRQFGGYAETPVDHYLPPIMPGYRNAHVYPVAKPNLTKARALARGHTRGGKLVLYVTTRREVQAQAQIVKQDLKRIGLNVQIVSYPPQQ